jgi:hypothetical protein
LLTSNYAHKTSFDFEFENANAKALSSVTALWTFSPARGI